ncbi:hypothetical protein MPER_15726, partial [Moniliophthora perniciosa FA553]
GRFKCPKTIIPKRKDSICTIEDTSDLPPYRMGQLAIINAPSSFTIIWSVIKPWLAKETVEKVDVMGKDYKERLLELVDADSLPSIL